MKQSRAKPHVLKKTRLLCLYHCMVTTATFPCGCTSPQPLLPDKNIGLVTERPCLVVTSLAPRAAPGRDSIPRPFAEPVNELLKEQKTQRPSFPPSVGRGRGGIAAQGGPAPAASASSILPLADPERRQSVRQLSCAPWSLAGPWPGPGPHLCRSTAAKCPAAGRRSGLAWSPGPPCQRGAPRPPACGGSAPGPHPPGQ